MCWSSLFISMAYTSNVLFRTGQGGTESNSDQWPLAVLQLKIPQTTKETFRGGNSSHLAK